MSLSDNYYYYYYFFLEKWGSRGGTFYINKNVLIKSFKQKINFLEKGCLQANHAEKEFFWRHKACKQGEKNQKKKKK